MLEVLFEKAKVRVTGFEPARSKRTPAPQAGASTNSATRAVFISVNKKSQALCLTFFCDRAGARTQDHLLKREVLYQLSYQVNFLFLNSSAKILSKLKNTSFFM
jgi:hypothetical protein